MKHIITIIICIASFFSVNEDCLAFDFSSITPSGQTLYYSITSETTVEVIAPGGVVFNNSNWAGYTKPVGSLTIPSSVSHLGITYSVTSIAGGAFMLCDRLTSVTIPNSVVEIGNWAFSASGVSVITLPSSPVLLREWVFEGTPWLESQPAGLVYLGNILYKYKGIAPDNYSLTIPSNINSIAGRAFNYGYEAGQTNLISVQIPNSVKMIGPSAFYKCHLNSITLPESIEVIGDLAFGYNYFSEVTIPSNVKYLGLNAFKGCTSLTTVNYNAVSAQGCNYYVSPSVFGDCINLSTINWGANIQQIPSGLLNGCSGITGELIIPNTVNRIEKYAFYGCSGFTGNLTIPSSITEIEEYAFCGCSGLTSMNIDATNIGDFAFGGCDNVTSLTVGENVNTVGSLAFSSMPNLTTLCYNARNLNSTNCGLSYPSLSSLFFGENVQHIPDYFMQISTNLTSISFPNSIISIGENAFYNSGISGELVIPENVQSIGSNSFSYCFDITSVKCLSATPPSINASIFPYLHDKPLIVPYLSLASYQSAPGWSLFQNIIGFGISDYSVSLTVNDPSMGTVIGSGTYAQGTTITIEATPYSGYHFERWSDNNTQNPRNIIVNDNVTLTAYFVADAENYLVNLSVNDPTMGVVSGGGTYEQGTAVTIVATPNTGYHFERWSDNNPQNPRSITVNCNITLTAIFAADNGIEDVDVSGVIVYSKDYHIFIDNANGEEVSVFSIEGRRIATSNNTTNLVSILVPVAGVYIVKVGNYLVRKVIVK